MRKLAENLFLELAKICRGMPRDLSIDIRKMREFLTSERASRPAGYMNNPRQFSAYAAYHFPVHLPELAWILEQTQKRFQIPLPRVILDFGSGPGTASISALMWLTGRGLKTPETLHFFDQSSRALDAAKALAATLKTPTKLISNRGNLLHPVDRRRISQHGDWILLSHVLNELGNGPRHRDRKLDLLNRLMRDHASPEGAYLFIVEPPLREPTLDLMWLRDKMADHDTELFEIPASIVAPCPSTTKSCPMSRLKFGWCYSQPPREWARKEGIALWDSQLERATHTELTHPGFSYMVVKIAPRKEWNLVPRAEDSDDELTNKDLPPSEREYPAHPPTNNPPKAKSHGIALSDESRVPSFVCRGTTVTREGRTPYRGAYVSNEKIHLESREERVATFNAKVKAHDEAMGIKPDPLASTRAEAAKPQREPQQRRPLEKRQVKSQIISQEKPQGKLHRPEKSTQRFVAGRRKSKEKPPRKP